MLRYGPGELLLVQPSASVHRPAPGPAAPHARAARERAERDRREGRRFQDWFFPAILVVTVADGVRRRRGGVARLPWTLESAASAIRALDRRRAWSRAYRESETSVPSVQSSASP